MALDENTLEKLNKYRLLVEQVYQQEAARGNAMEALDEIILKTTAAWSREDFQTVLGFTLGQWLGTLDSLNADVPTSLMLEKLVQQLSMFQMSLDLDKPLE